MPGYLVHLACCNPTVLQHSTPFRIGVEAPDLLNLYYYRFEINGAEEHWEKIWIPGVPHFERLKPLLSQKGGTHFGKSSNPDIICFWNFLSNSDKDADFWRGYLWHLLSDAVFYKRLNFHTLISVKVNPYSSERDASIRREKHELHKDWDRTNQLITQLYNVHIPPELEALNVIRFDSSEPKYVSRFVLLATIEELRHINPLSSKECIEKIFKVLLNV